MLTDHFIAASFRHETKHFCFPSSQRVIISSHKLHASLTNGIVFCNSPRLTQILHPAQLLDQFPRHFRMNERVAFGYGTNCIDERFRLHIFEQITGGSFAERLKYIALIIVDRQNNNFHLWKRLAKLRCGVHPV
ncbi:hypothetical protein D3C77_534360 [compost metagenome]